ncbi:hypothetical protein [Chitinophaga pinensis]|uniref:Uncharacterized protein n=1 Tax=Chitinophaga pinensis TaxID=79329 RepID=A0A5C6LXS0_9BACT|nr:hypothetical protein [Chitinophaga pinensis]TWW00146.1 hypothetical protein FEF09_12450 [Chitinophaga pinensis]
MTPGITEQQLDRIIDYLKAHKITDPELQQEIADHLAISIEMRMTQGADFETALQTVCKEWEQKDLLEIGRNKESYYSYPSFLNAAFLNKFLFFAVAVLLTGIYMRMEHLPLRRVVILSGGALIGYIYLPLLLLHSLDGFANKTRQVSGFVVQFALLHAGIAYLLHWRMNAFLAVFAFLISFTWLIIYIIIPSIKSKQYI